MSFSPLLGILIRFYVDLSFFMTNIMAICTLDVLKQDF